MAELRNQAAYNAAKLQMYKDWADPEKRAAMQADAKRELDRAVEEAKFMEAQNQAVFEIPEYRKLEDMVKVKEFVKPLREKPKESAIQHIINWFR